VRVAQKEDREEGIHEQDIFEGVVFFLKCCTKTQVKLWSH
jgi:hypothetical protein